MADLVIQIQKKTDGSASLTCRRPDGSVTWQRQVGQQGRFFPLHDLTHYAVESVLGYTQAFFGLVADGWDISDFDKPWRRGEPPEQAILAEFIVGFLDLERASSEESSAEALRDAAAIFFEQHGLRVRCGMTDEQLERIREVREDLFARWAALPLGKTLALPFPGLVPDPLAPPQPARGKADGKRRDDGE